MRYKPLKGASRSNVGMSPLESPFTPSFLWIILRASAILLYLYTPLWKSKKDMYYFKFQFKILLLLVWWFSITSYLVLTTVIGISKAPEMVLAVTPKVTACRGVIDSFKSNVLLSQCKVEKYRPTPGMTLVID